MAGFFYVYILQTERDENQFYTGLTDDLRKRIETHNSGRVRHTSKWRPWPIEGWIFRIERALRSSRGT
jgi:predicted GIY-YIG superfamily endonuclease